jgi:hypothetical protein
METIKQGILNTLNGTASIKCAVVEVLMPEGEAIYTLKQNHSAEELAAFLEALDFVVDGKDGYISDGTIWVKGGGWYEWGWYSEYADEGYWRFNIEPEIPEECR